MTARELNLLDEHLQNLAKHLTEVNSYVMDPVQRLAMKQAKLELDFARNLVAKSHLSHKDETLDLLASYPKPPSCK